MSYPHEVMVKYTPGDNWLEVSTWIKEYCKGRAVWKYIQPGIGGVMTLELKEDVIFFKLRWSGQI